MKYFFLFLTVISQVALANQETSNQGYYFSPKLNFSVTSISDTEVSGSYQKPYTIYTDQDKGNKDDTTFDIVSGALLSFGYKTKNWRAELSYSYRFRFDVNGNVGEPVPGKYENHQNLPGRFTLNVNTQSIRFDYNYYIDAWRTENLKPYIGFNIDYLRHSILSKVRNKYNYSEVTLKENELTYGLGLGTEISFDENIDWVVSVHYIDLGRIDIGPQSKNASFSADSFYAFDILFGINYYF